MICWLVIFGRTIELSYHELTAVVSLPITRVTPDVARIEDQEEKLKPEWLITRLGGAVKIARERGSTARLTPDAMLPFFGDERTSLTFGVSVYGNHSAFATPMLRSMKEALERRGVHARYVAAKDGNALSSVVVKKQGVYELVVTATSKEFIVGETVALQDFEAWNRRDYGRPFVDPKAGMLPPKVARIAVNVAMRAIPASEPGSSDKKDWIPDENGYGTVTRLGRNDNNTRPTLLDPFCGMGTIVGEAMLTGWHVFGSDQSHEAVRKAEKNLEWIKRSFPQARDARSKLFVSDATHVSEHLPKESVDAIVTEPYLGPAFGGNDQFPISNNQLKNIVKGLEKLYIGCLKEWQRVLIPGGNIVIALPQYAIGERMYGVKNVIDRCENLGYTVILGPLDYGREKAIVRRKFYVLKRMNQ